MECERCKKDFPASKLRVDIKGQRLLCEDCFNFVRTGTLVPEKIKEEAKKDFLEVRRKLALTTQERLEKLGVKKEEFQCKSCNYRFFRSKGYAGICPYCGENKVVPYKMDVNLKEINEILSSE